MYNRRFSRGPKTDNCPFCGKISITQNAQGVPVCQAHKERNLENIKCACGEYLEVLSGKWGPYFRCLNCGNINFKKVMAMNPQNSTTLSSNPSTKSQSSFSSNSQQNTHKRAPKEIWITSDQVDIIY